MAGVIHLARLINRLTEASIKKTEPGKHRDGNGLELRVGAGGGKSWVLIFRDRGKRPEFGLGSYPVVSLTEARQKALALRKARADGIDVRAKRQKATEPKLAAVTFGSCAEQYIRSQRAGWKGDHTRKQWEASLAAYALPILGRMPVQDVDTAAVLRCIEPIWQDKPETADRVRRRVESILDWASARSYRQGENSARWRAHIENLLPSPRKVR